MRPVIKKCPTCGSRRIHLVTGDYSTTARRRRIIVPAVRRYECPGCGEILLDYEAMKQIESRRFPESKARRFVKTG